MKLSLLAFIFAVASFGFVSAAEACACNAAVNSTVDSRREAVRAAFTAADVVFIGDRISDSTSTADIITATLAVGKTWKGTLDKTARLYQAIRRGPNLIEMSTCTLIVDKGTWVVFASYKDPGLLAAGDCGPSGRLEHRAETIKFLDEISRTHHVGDPAEVQQPFRVDRAGLTRHAADSGACNNGAAAADPSVSSLNERRTACAV